MLRVVGTHGECVMSKTNEFWNYAEEATLWACRATSEDERQALVDLARTWTQAALAERHARIDADHTPNRCIRPLQVVASARGAF